MKNTTLVLNNLDLHNDVEVIECSHDILPGKEEYPFDLKNKYVEEFLPYYEGYRSPDTWYIMSEVNMWSHVGTHIEAPFHYLRDGKDIASLPLRNLIGECSLVDFSEKKIGEAVNCEELESRGSHILSGDMVFIRFNRSRQYRTSQSRKRPYLSKDAVSWLINKNISCLGVDVSGIETHKIYDQPNHLQLFSHNIPLIEHLANLEKITKPRFFVVAVPIRVRGLDSCPVSVLAFVNKD